jgi:acyl dehydratase
MDKNALPEKIKNWLGKTVITEPSPFEVQSVLWQNFCSAIEDSNPLYWNQIEASEHTNMTIAHPALLPSWLHDFEWHPERERRMPMELHFLVKKALDLPLGIVTEVEIEFHEPVVQGDRISAEQKLLSVSDKVDTKLGKGRYWIIEVIYKNQSNELVGMQKIHFLGYKK